MAWSPRVAVVHLQTHALAHSIRRCAHYVRMAIAAGGIDVAGTENAKDFGRNLEAAGFFAIDPTAPLLPGDVAIIQAIPGHPEGHACMWDGHQWISDFRQLHGMYPGPEYRAQKPPFKIYRHR